MALDVCTEETGIALFRLMFGVVLLSSFLERSKSMVGLLLLLGNYSFVTGLGGTGQIVPAFGLLADMVGVKRAAHGGWLASLLVRRCP